MLDGVVSLPNADRLNPLPTEGVGESESRSALCQFVAGSENCLVEPALRLTLAGRTSCCNPLVFYGPSGTGKSYLVRGLAAEWKERNRRQKVIVTAAVDFARELNDAIETQATDEFRAQYRHAAFLVIEDVGQLAGKQAAQEELLATLDALLPAGRQVVATASETPSMLPGLIPGLRSRLISGLTVPLSLPGRDTRMILLRRWAQSRGIELVEPVVKLLADGLSVTAPELLGALIQLAVGAQQDDQAIDAAAVRRYLVARHGSSEPSLRDIAAATARHFSQTVADLRSPSRRRGVVIARGVAMFLARQLTGTSLEQIGRYFGGRDHTTVMHGCSKTASLVKSDPAIRQAVERLRKKWQEAG